MPLTLDEFEAWLNSLPEDYTFLGERYSTESCPLAKWISARFGEKYLVTSSSYYLFIDQNKPPKKQGRTGLPQWASAFIQRFDVKHARIQPGILPPMFVVVPLVAVLEIVKEMKADRYV